jgi:hypothetical protein
MSLACKLPYVVVDEIIVKELKRYIKYHENPDYDIHETAYNKYRHLEALYGVLAMYTTASEYKKFVGKRHKKKQKWSEE